MSAATVPEAAPITRRRAQTREKLMAAAIAVFAERGVIAASVEEICEQAGFTRGAFYSNFASKDELFFELLKTQADEQMTRVERVIDTLHAADDAAAEGPGAGADAAPASDAEKISAAVEAFVADQPADRQWILAQNELRLYAARHPQVAEEFLEFQQQCNEQFGHLVIRALRYINREFSVPLDEAITMAMAMYEQGLITALLDPPGDGRLSLKPLSQLLLAITRPVAPAAPGA